MEYKIDFNSQEGLIVKDPKGQYASHRNYNNFVDVFKIFTEPLNQTISKATLIFTERAQRVLNQKQRRNLRDIVTLPSNKTLESVKQKELRV